VPIIEKLRREFPKIDSQMVICEQQLGPTARFRTWADAADCENTSTWSSIVYADMLVRPEYLREVTGAVREREHGFVTSIYRALPGKTICPRWRRSHLHRVHAGSAAGAH